MHGNRSLKKLVPFSHVSFIICILLGRVETFLVHRPCRLYRIGNCAPARLGPERCTGSRYITRALLFTASSLRYRLVAAASSRTLKAARKRGSVARQTDAKHFDYESSEGLCKRLFHNDLTRSLVSPDLGNLLGVFLYACRSSCCRAATSLTEPAPAASLSTAESLTTRPSL